MDQDRKEAQRFLELLTTDTQFTFQSFDDDNSRKAKKLARILHGTLDEHWAALCKLNNAGAGIYVTVNATDGGGRRIANITKVRAVFTDLDGAPLAPVQAAEPPPHIIVVTSPGKWHAYWKAEGLPLEKFSDVQKALAAQFGGDPKVHDVTRVMRLPGFWHQKAMPHLVAIVAGRQGAAEWPSVTVESSGGDDEDAIPDYLRDWQGKSGAAMLEDYQTWQQRLNTAALANLAAWVPELWPEAKATGAGGYRITSRMLGRNLEEDLSIDPTGIVDFGISDQGDEREGRRTPIDIVVEHGGKEFPAAVAWLEEQLGIKKEESAEETTINVTHFLHYREMNNFIFTPTGALWPGPSVDAEIGPIQEGKKKIKASHWIARRLFIHQMTWAPGMPAVIKDKVIKEGGWINQSGVNVYNEYRPPMVTGGEAARADKWINHCHKVFGEQADHIIKWLAQRVQYPHLKINHALVLGSSDHGVGKDTMLEPVKYAVGPWNFKEISAEQMMGRFNSYLMTVILRINEARDLGEANRVTFYNHMKGLLATPPGELHIDQKNIKEHYIVNCFGAIITTNYRTDGLFLPREDRRHYVAWSERTRNDFTTEYWNSLWSWYENGGYWHVAAYLRELDLSNFNFKEPPPQTDAFKAIVEANQPPEDSELEDVLEIIGNPSVITIATLLGRINANEKQIATAINYEQLITWLENRGNKRMIPRRLEKCGYTAVPSKRNDGLWSINDRKQTIYVHNRINDKTERENAVKAFIEKETSPHLGKVN